MTTDSDFTSVFQGTITEVLQLKAILDNKGIDNFVQNENMGQLFPLYGGHGGVKPVKLLVRNADVNRTKNIIKNYF